MNKERSRLNNPRRPSLTQAERQEAWENTGIFKLGCNWCHSKTGRVFVFKTTKWNWCEEMNDRHDSE